MSVEPRTDEPERRFADGAVLATRTPRGDEPHSAQRPVTLTVRRTRWHQSRLLVTFEGVDDRNAAEALRGLSLAVRFDPAEMPEDPEEFYDHQLVGLAVQNENGGVVGEVSEVLHLPSQDMLVVRRAAAGRDPGSASIGRHAERNGSADPAPARVPAAW